MGNIILRSTLLGLGLSMDAGAVAIANGMKYRDMPKRSMLFISFLFGFFQGGMPLLGYWIGRAIFAQIQEFLPWLALLILGFLGGNMLYGSFQSDTKAMKKLTPFFLYSSSHCHLYRCTINWNYNCTLYLDTSYNMCGYHYGSYDDYFLSWDLFREKVWSKI